MVRSRRNTLALQAALVTACGVSLGAVLQSMGILSTSPLGKIGAATGLPIVGLIVSGLAGALSFLIVRDSWNRTIVVGSEDISVRDDLGHYTLPYADIRDVKSVPLGGVVVAIRDPELWLASASGHGDIRRRRTAVITEKYGGHVWFYDKHLSTGGPAFVDLVRDRMNARAGSPERE